jgi:hypothetical protein
MNEICDYGESLVSPFGGSYGAPSRTETPHSERRAEPVRPHTTGLLFGIRTTPRSPLGTGGGVVPGLVAARLYGTNRTDTIP